MDAIPLNVREDLNFYVSRMIKVFLNDEVIVSEGGKGFAFCRGAQLMAIAGTNPVIVVEWSLNLHADVTKVVALANDMDGNVINLVLAGDGALIRESGILMRLRVSGGTGVVAQGHIKFTRTR